MPLNEEQKYAYDVMASGANVFLTGNAGTGKSYVIRKFIDDHKDSTIVCAPTGIAAYLIGGTTLHRIFNIPSAPCPFAGNKHNRLLDTAKTLIIDEISMVRRDVFDYVIKIIRNTEKKNGKRIQIIVCGDFAQLPPVVTQSVKPVLEKQYGADAGYCYAFQSPFWNELGFHNIRLTKIVRQEDAETAAVLNRVRLGEMAAVREVFTSVSHNPFIRDAITIVATNFMAERINDEEIKKIDAPAMNFYMTVDGNVRNDEIICAEQMTLKPGCRVMLIANLGPTVVNGMTGTVKTIFSDPFTGADVVHVQWDNGETTIVSPYKWTVYDYISTDDGKIEQVEVGAYTQLPLKPAYAVTIHKSQGQTYELANLIADAVFAPGQLYVALSRVKHFERLYVAPGIKIYKLADPLVVRWYDELQYDDFPVPEKTNSPSQTLQTQPITPEQQKNRRGRKSTWRGEPTTIIRVPVRIADRLMLEAHRMIDEEVPQTI